MSDLINRFAAEFSFFTADSSLSRALSLSEAILLTYQYWDDKRCGKAAPLRAELDVSADLPTVARQLVFVDVEADASTRRFRMRPMAMMAGARDPGGVYFDERLSGVLLEKTLRSCNRVCDLGAPEFVIVDPTIDFPYYYCRLCVPVTRSGAEIDMQLHAVDVLSPYDR